MSENERSEIPGTAVTKAVTSAVTKVAAEVVIERLAAGGDGVGRLADGRIVFVPDTTIGDRVEIALTEEKKRFARGTGPGNLVDADSAGRYLTRSISHCAIDKVRARSRLIAFAEPDEPGPRLTPVDADQEARLLRAEAAVLERRRLTRMLEELQTLPKQQREAVELLVLRQPPLKLREASEITGAPISTLHSRLQTALDSLRTILSESEN